MSHEYCCLCLQSLAIPPKITKQPTLREKRILIQAEGTQPMKYQWLKDDEELLSDGEDYKGTTTAELVIVGTGPQVKGNYKCLVKHKYGEIFSTGTHYGRQCSTPLAKSKPCKCFFLYRPLCC